MKTDWARDCHMTLSILSAGHGRAGMLSLQQPFDLGKYPAAIERMPTLWGAYSTSGCLTSIRLPRFSRCCATQTRVLH
jgi:hypothetical protein